jgi:hypothetical protein
MAGCEENQSFMACHLERSACTTCLTRLTLRWVMPLTSDAARNPVPDAGLSERLANHPMQQGRSLLIEATAAVERGNFTKLLQTRWCHNELLMG